MLLRKYDNYLDSQNIFIDISFYGKDKLLHGLTAWPDNNRLLRKLLYKIPFLRPYSFQHKEEFSVSHCGIQKPQCGIYISQCGIQILHCETENISRRSRKYARRYKRIYSCFLKDVTWIAKESIECSFYISFNKCQTGNLVFAG